VTGFLLDHPHTFDISTMNQYSAIAQIITLDALSKNLRQESIVAVDKNCVFDSSTSMDDSTTTMLHSLIIK